MIRDYKAETENRVEFIRRLLDDSGARGIVFGNSGGKDSALTGILCKKACADTVGLIMPCCTTCNYCDDMSDAEAIAEQFGIETRSVDLTKTYEVMHLALTASAEITASATLNIAPRLRMTALYAVAASESRIVAGTSNRSERYMGYYTKWGDGAFDFNPIADLTVTEILEFLRHLGAPDRIIDKAPSGGLFDGQTDEDDMGITYASIDGFLLNGQCAPEAMEIIARYHRTSGHKRKAPKAYGVSGEDTV